MPAEDGLNADCQGLAKEARRQFRNTVITHTVITHSDSWRLCAPDGELAWRQWEGDLVVFNPVSGATHFLDVASGEILRALMAGPARRDDLARRLARLLEVDLGDDVRAALDNILDSLDDLGLAEPAGT